jgi:hypothetical protein
LLRWISAWVVAVGVVVGASGTQAAPNYQGIWWNAPAASESGWGINFAHQGDTIFATWFTFGLDGKPLWLVLAANRTAGENYTGDIYSGTGPSYAQVPFDPAQVTATKVGTATLAFGGDASATFAYTVNGITQSKSITRQAFGDPQPTCTWGGTADAVAATNYQDMWWASPPGTESGWGINFAHQGDTIFASWFTFGLDGKPLWMVAAARKTAPRIYTGTLFTGTGPAFNAVPFDPNQVVGSAAGNTTIRFLDGENALFVYTVGGVTQTKAITRQSFSSAPTVCTSGPDTTVPYDVAVNTASVRLLPGGTRDVYVTLTPRNGFTGSATLSAAGLPPGIDATFTPATVALGASPVSAVLRLTASEAAAPTAAQSVVTIGAQAGGGRSGATAIAIGVAPAGDPVATRLAGLAAVEEQARVLNRQGLAPAAFLQAIAQFMAARPEYRAAGVDSETLTAWGRFTDGTLHLVTENRQPAPPLAAAAASAAHASVTRKAGAELPQATKARMFHSFGANFEGQTPVDEMRGYLKSKGWAVRAGAEGIADVGTLKGTSGDGFFYFNTHGGRGDVDDQNEPDGKMYSIQSSTLVDDDYQKVFAADLAALRLVHFTARNGEQIRIAGISVHADWDTRYAITYRFVTEYMSFTNESVVLINACYSSRNDRFVQAFLGKGAGVYLGWSELLSSSAAYESAPYFVDRMLGANQNAKKETPPQRAFAYDAVLADMAKKGLDIDKGTGGKLQAFVKPGLLFPPIFAPSIRYVEVDEYDNALTLVGEFGTDRPKVTVGGAEIAVQSWSATEIVATLPVSGAGSSGDVIVEVRSVKSNARQLTEWTLLAQYNWDNVFDTAGHRFDGSGTLRFRADIGGYRLAPGEAPKYKLRGGVATRDSSMTVTASGTNVDSSGCVTTLVGTGTYVSPALLGGTPGTIILAAFKAIGDTRSSGLGLAFGSLTPPHQIVLSGPKGCLQGAFPYAAAFGLLDVEADFPTDQSDNAQQMTLPAMLFPLDTSYGIPATSRSYSDFGGSLRLAWPGSVAKNPPRDTIDAGK